MRWVLQSFVDDTGDLLFKDLWLRPGLAPRDRSLITVASMVRSLNLLETDPIKLCAKAGRG